MYSRSTVRCRLSSSGAYASNAGRDGRIDRGLGLCAWHATRRTRAPSCGLSRSSGGEIQSPYTTPLRGREQITSGLTDIHVTYIADDTTRPRRRRRCKAPAGGWAHGCNRTRATHGGLHRYRLTTLLAIPCHRWAAAVPTAASPLDGQYTSGRAERGRVNVMAGGFREERGRELRGKAAET